MTLPVPVVGNEPGPDYAIDVNNCLSIVDQHNHTLGSGVPITPAAMNISADLTMQQHSLTNIQSLQLSPQTSFATPLSLYVAPGGENPDINDLWYNDGNGTAVQLTKQGIVNATLASLPGESYSAGTFTWKQGVGSTVPADFDIGSITIRPNIAATTYGTLIQVNPAIATSFTLTLPNNPSGLASNSFLTLDPSGNITAGPTVNAGLTTSNLSATAGILGSQIAALTLTASNIANSTITGAKIAGSTITGSNIANNTIAYANIDTTQLFGGQLISLRQTWTTPGITVWTVPAGVNTVFVMVVGGGGGGGGAGVAGGGGGGAGSLPVCAPITVTPGGNVGISVGGGGGGGAANTNPGTGGAGGASYFNGPVSSIYSEGGAAGVGHGGGGAGGSGASSVAGMFHATGGAGGNTYGVTGGSGQGSVYNLGAPSAGGPPASATNAGGGGGGGAGHGGGGAGGQGYVHDTGYGGGVGGGGGGGGGNNFGGGNGGPGGNGAVYVWY